MNVDSSWRHCTRATSPSTLLPWSKYQEVDNKPFSPEIES